MRRAVPLTLGSAALGLDAFVVAGILPVISADLHASVSAVGQMVTVFTLSYALLAPLCAAAAAGRPLRTVLLLALLVFTAGNVLTAVSSSLPLLLGARALAGVGAGLYSPMAAAAAAGLVAPERRGRALAMITGGMSTGVVLGVPLGLVLAQHAGWRSTMWLVVALTALAFAGIALYLPNVQAAAAPSVRARLGAMADRSVVAVALVTLAGSIASIGTYTYVSQLLGRTLHTSQITPDLWAWGLGGLLGSFAIGQLVDRWRDTRALVSTVLGILGTVLALLPLLGQQALGAGLLLFVWGAVGWSQVAPQQHRMLKLRPDDGTGAVSLNSSATYLGNAIGSAVGGVLLGCGLSPLGLPLILGVLALLGAVANLVWTPAAPAKDTGVGVTGPARGVPVDRP
ncbi:MFS transporter [Streptomyces sp. NPDC052109]|uniref:MFS transporter n=1 Tax=Streptomyces sp. NPDC052109 TaxID=3155527 RepID=UPI003426177C